MRRLDPAGSGNETIEQLVAATGMSVRNIRAHQAGAERAQKLTLAELGRRFRVRAEEAPGVLATAERLGVLRPIGEGVYEAAFMEITRRLAERADEL